MPNTWRDVWSGKADGYAERGTGAIEDLLSLDGYGSGLGYISPESWFEYVRETCAAIDLTADDEFFEVGCGAGAFMHALVPSPRIQLGVDYSANQIHVASAFGSENMTFLELDANDIHELKREFDVVLVNSVMQYFPSLDYAEEFIAKVVATLRNGGRGCILDVNDIDRKDEFLRNRYAELGGRKVYLERYNGLQHVFFSRNRIRGILNHLGVGSVRIVDQFIRNCRISEFRFNVFFEK